MADTAELKTVVELAVAQGFLNHHDAVRILTKPGWDNVHVRICGMDMDLIAYSKSQHAAWFCEVTASGSQGHRSKKHGTRDTHLGARKKLCEAMCRFRILQCNEERVRKLLPEGSRIRYAFLVPRGCRFIRKLGWLEQLPAVGDFFIEEVDLPEEVNEILARVLLGCSVERSMP
jgi:hypothetical protein